VFDFFDAVHFGDRLRKSEHEFRAISHVGGGARALPDAERVDARAGELRFPAQENALVGMNTSSNMR
jgi:hypothetical protein